jgi:hypothetical protein
MHYYATPYTKPSDKNTAYSKKSDVNTAFSKTSDKNTNFTQPSKVNTRYDLSTYWLFSDRLLFGDHDRFGKEIKVAYKFINTGYST